MRFSLGDPGRGVDYVRGKARPYAGCGFSAGVRACGDPGPGSPTTHLGHQDQQGEDRGGNQPDEAQAVMSLGQGNSTADQEYRDEARLARTPDPRPPPAPRRPDRPFPLGLGGIGHHGVGLSASPKVKAVSFPVTELTGVTGSGPPPAFCGCEPDDTAWAAGPHSFLR
jgi:hypothetical protein